MSNLQHTDMEHTPEMRRESSLRRTERPSDGPTRPSADHRRPAGEQRVRIRRRRRKRSILRTTILPMLCCGLAVTALVLFIGRVARPFALYDREKAATQDLQNQLDSLHKQNDSLERRIKYLQTPEGRAQAARELGYVKPGEISLVIPTDKGSKPQP